MFTQATLSASSLLAAGTKPSFFHSISKGKVPKISEKPQQAFHLGFPPEKINLHGWGQVLGLAGMALASITTAHMVFWTGAWNNADNTTVFWLLLISTCKTARLSLFPAPAPFPLPLRGRMEEVAITLRRGTAGRTDSSRSRGYFLPC